MLYIYLILYIIPYIDIIYSIHIIYKYIYVGLQERGLTCLMSGLDNLRNMVGSPIAGQCQ